MKLCDLLDRLSLDYALIGGIAAILYGVQRTTLDIDVLVHLEKPEEVLALVSTLRNNGFEVVLEEALQALKEKSHFTALYEKTVVDFKFAKSSLDFSTLGRRRMILIGSVKVYISPLEELITAKLKILGSLKDIEDSLQLMYMFHDKIDWSYLAELTGKDPFIYLNELLDVILNEFKDEKRVLEKIHELRHLKAKIRDIINPKHQL